MAEGVRARADARRCSRRSAIPSWRTPRSTSSARTGSRRRPARSRRCSSARASRPARPSRRTSAPGPSGSRVDGKNVDFEAAIGRIRPEAESQGATQFETVCAAAFAEFAAREIDVAVVEAGLGGRLDATNVLRSHVVLLTNVGLEHTDVLGETREEIAAEKLAVVQEGTIAVLPDEEFAAPGGAERRRRRGARGGGGVSGASRRARGAGHAAGPARAQRRRGSRRSPQRRGRRLARGAARPLRLHPRGLDPARQGRRRDARRARPHGVTTGRDDVLERTLASCRGARRRSPSGTSPRWRSSPIPLLRWPARASMDPFSSPGRSIFLPISRGTSA